MEDSFNCLGRNIWTEDFLFLERLFLWPSNKIWTLPRPYFVISFVAGWSALSKLHICRHKEVKRFHFIFNCSTYNFDVKDSFKLTRLPGWYCKMDNIFYVIPNNPKLFVISYLLFWYAVIWRFFLEKKNSAGCLLKTMWLMKNLNIVIWWENLCAFEKAKFHQPLCFFFSK